MKPDKQLSLFIWIPATFGILMHLIADLLWAFGNPFLIPEFYTSRFNGPLEANLWILNQIGGAGCVLGIILLFCYFNLTFYLFKK